MKPVIPACLTLAALAAAPLAANWQVVENFESGTLGSQWFVGFREGAGEGGGLEVITDPQDSANKIGSFTPGVASGTAAYNVRAYVPIPPVPVTNTATTVYYRFKLPTIDFGGQQFIAQVDTVWGLSAKEAPAGYADYTSLMRVEFDNSFDVYDGTGYNIVRDTLTADTWYEVWIVVNHSARQYRVYARGGSEFPERVQIFPFTGEWTNYRDPAIEPLTKFLLLSSAGTAAAVKGIDPFYFDDIHIDLTGVNLSVPGEGSGCDNGPGVFAAYCVTNGWATTGDYMGDVYVTHYPWVFVHDLQQYAFIGGGDEAGTWIHLHK
jgi:hypothetical protein